MRSVQRMISQLDTQHFGFKVAKISLIELNDLSETLSDLYAEGVKLVITRIPTKAIDIVHGLERRKFELMDTQVTYRINMSEIDKSKLNERVFVREIKKNEVDKLMDIARKAFDGYGHYSADKRLNPELSTKLYVDWIRRSCTDKSVADNVFVAEEDGKLLGFLTFKIHENENYRYGVGGMGAVLPSTSGKGVFQSVVIRGLKWGKRINLKWEEHNVLISNYAVNRVFSKLGFRIVDSNHTFHKWLINNDERTQQNRKVFHDD